MDPSIRSGLPDGSLEGINLRNRSGSVELASHKVERWMGELVSPRSARIANAFGRLSSDEEGTTDEAATTKTPCCGLSGNALSLLTAATLFTVITGVQYVFGIIANSLALQADCMSMGVDALTYLGSLFVECRQSANPYDKRSMELGMAAVSYCLLLYFTIDFLIEGARVVTASDEDGAVVNGYIVLGFALGGLLFDVISLLVFQQFGEHDGGASEDADITPEGRNSLTCGINVNMCAALLHVMSDLLRSSTTLIESIVILLVPDISSSKADGFSALIVCSIIALGTIGALFTWARAMWEHLTISEPPQGAPIGDVALYRVEEAPSVGSVQTAESSDLYGKLDQVDDDNLVNKIQIHCDTVTVPVERG